MHLLEPLLKQLYPSCSVHTVRTQCWRRRVYQTDAAFDENHAVNMFQKERSVVFNEVVSCHDCVWPVVDE